MTIGERIKSARKQAGMTQQELAERLNVSCVGISQWESGRRNPKQHTLARIADVLDIPLSRLTGARAMSDDEIFDTITRAWSRADYQATMLQQQDGQQEEIERWERICAELRKLNEDILAEHQAEKEKLPEREEKLLKIFRQLNFKGQRKLLSLAGDYAKIQDYTSSP